MNVISGSENYLAISDTQSPFEAEHALPFCKYVKKFFKIPDENVLHVGDETDQYFGGLWKKSPNALHSAGSELAESIEKLKEWYAAFPKMKLAISNHGTRWARKAFDAEIPSQLLRSYKEVIQAPKDWVWREKWTFNTKHPFQMIHGMGYSGTLGHRNAAIDAGISTVMGHLHSAAGINYIRTENLKLWAFNVGCLIDTEAYAFEYGKYNRLKPCLGAGVILNQGQMPIWVPYE